MSAIGYDGKRKPSSLLTSAMRGSDGVNRSPHSQESESIVVKYVEDALTVRGGGSLSAEYSRLVTEISEGENVDRTLSALCRLSSLIMSDTHEALLSSVMKLNIATLNKDTGMHLRNLFVSLCTANAKFISLALGSLVKSMLPTQRMTEQGMRVEAADQEGYMRTVDTIVALLRNFPTSTEALLNIVEDAFPHRRYAAEVQITFLTNVIRLAEALPHMKEGLFLIICNKLVEIDVEIKLELLPDFQHDGEEDEEEQGEEEELDEESNALPFGELDLDEHEAAAAAERVAQQQRQAQQTSTSRVDTYGKKPTATAEEIHNIHAMANKMDALMCVMFTYLDELRKRGGKAMEETFEYFLVAFLKKVLPTHRSKYTQYLLFLSCSFHPAFPERLLAILYSGLFDHKNHEVYRISCSAYIASFVARALYLPIQMSFTAVELLSAWANEYIDKYESTVRYPDAEKHCVFYSNCQSLFYVLCYRLRELMDMEEFIQYLPTLRMERLLRSRFNPLKLMLPTIARELVKQLKEFEICNVDSIVEENKSIILPKKTEWGGKNELDSFFPFDPYLLKNSLPFITPLYRNWGHHGEEDFLPLGDGDEDNEDERDSQSNSLVHSMRSTSSYGFASDGGSIPIGASYEHSQGSHEGLESMAFSPEVQSQYLQGMSFVKAANKSGGRRASVLGKSRPSERKESPAPEGSSSPAEGPFSLFC